MYDYGARIYDSRAARFLSVDPLTSKFPELTPYQFASNMPIWATDFDGQEAKLYVFNRYKDGHTEVAMIKDVDKSSYDDPVDNLHNRLEKDFKIKFPNEGLVILNLYHDEHDNLKGQFVYCDPKYKYQEEKIKEPDFEEAEIPLAVKIIRDVNPIYAIFNLGHIAFTSDHTDISGNKASLLGIGANVLNTFSFGVESFGIEMFGSVSKEAPIAVDVTTTTIDHYIDKSKAANKKKLESKHVQTKVSKKESKKKD